jgi:hypothetical protein
MSSVLEGFLERSALYTPQKMGYISPGNLSLPAYNALVRNEVQRMENEGHVANACISSDLAELDKARQIEGLTLCCLIPDFIDEDELMILFQCVGGSKANGRYYFTQGFRNDPTNLSHKFRKPKQMLDSQIGTIYHNFPYVYQDFALVITHDPRIEQIIQNSPVLLQYTTRFSLP